MTDLFLQPRESNRGCLILGLFAFVLLGLGTWWLLRSPDGAGEPAQARPQSEDPAAVEPGESPADPTGTAGTASSGSPAAAPPVRRPPPESLVAELAQARTLMAQGELERARAAARTLAADSRNPETKAAAEALLGDLHLRMAFSPVPMAEKIEYKVRPGDTLGGIAKRHSITVELLQRGNGLTGNLIRAHQKLSVLPGKFSIRVSKSDFTLTVLYDGRFFKRYAVGTGKDDKTPEGKFKVVDRIKEPDWWRPDGKKIPFGSKENLLGTRWIAIDLRSYGIHGTWEPETIGKPLSAGCVRLRNEEVEELYDLIPLGTPVEIVK
jgi:LysM repeat protein